MGKEIDKGIDKKQFLKQEFFKNDNWSKTKVKKHYGSYGSAYVDFYEVYRYDFPELFGTPVVNIRVLGKKPNKKLKAFVEFLRAKTFFTNTSPAHIFNTKIPLIEGIDKVKMAKEMIEFKTKYLDTSNDAFFIAMTKIIAHGLTSSTLKQYLKEGKKE